MVVDVINGVEELLIKGRRQRPSPELVQPSPRKRVADAALTLLIVPSVHWHGILAVCRERGISSHSFSLLRREHAKGCFLMSFRTFRRVSTVPLDASSIAWHVAITQKAEEALLLAVPEQLVALKVQHGPTGRTTAAAAHVFRKTMEGVLVWSEMLQGKVPMPTTLEERSKLAQESAKAMQTCSLCHVAADKEQKSVKAHRGVLLYCSGVETKVWFSLLAKFLSFFAKFLLFFFYF